VEDNAVQAVVGRAGAALRDAAKRHKQLSRTHRHISADLLDERRVLIEKCEEMGIRYVEEPEAPVTRQSQVEGHSLKGAEADDGQGNGD